MITSLHETVVFLRILPIIRLFLEPAQSLLADQHKLSPTVVLLQPLPNQIGDNRCHIGLALDLLSQF
jgi:hypothetical protein